MTTPDDDKIIIIIPRFGSPFIAINLKQTYSDMYNVLGGEPVRTNYTDRDINIHPKNLQCPNWKNLQILLGKMHKNYYRLFIGMNSYDNYNDNKNYNILFMEYNTLSYNKYYPCRGNLLLTIKKKWLVKYDINLREGIYSTLNNPPRVGIQHDYEELDECEYITLNQYGYP